jgi:uroporphyrin-III C-methyltransferase
VAAVSGPALAHAAARLVAPDFTPGSVWLVGAGPGDPGLLTLHVAHALASADVVLHDALVPTEILALVATQHRIAVGKRVGGTRTPQLRINARLVGLAHQGLRVLRLKGGDPLVFGRGVEEAMALAAAGVPFRIVPGVSAGIGGTASAGIPLTHRNLVRSVAFATGHDSRGDLPEGLDFAALSRGADVLVFYMGLRQAGPIAARLIAAGRSPDEAVAFVSDATTAHQRVRLASLRLAGVIASGLPRHAPTLIVVGPVLALHEVLTPLQQAAPMTVAMMPEPSLATA